MRPTPAAKKQLFVRCFLWTEGWPAIRADSSGQRLCRSRAGAICQKWRDDVKRLANPAAAAEPFR